MADSGNGDGTNQGFSSVSTQEKGSRNKRKYLAEFSLDVPIDKSSLCLTEFPRYELLEEKIRNILSGLGSLEGRRDQPKEEEEEFQSSEWEDPIACQLEELLSHNLCAIFRCAINKIAECGYGEEVAERVVLRNGFYYGSNDTVSNIVDGALFLLRRENEFDASIYTLFEDLKNLVEYTLLEMICVLKEIKPCLSVTEAMWCLLICDLNLSHACAMEGDPSSLLGGKGVLGESASDSAVPHFKSEAQSSQTTLSNPSKPYISKPSNPDPQNSWSEILTFGDLHKSSNRDPQISWSDNVPNRKTPLVHELLSITEKESLVSLPVTAGKSLGIIGEHVQTVSQTFVMEGKSGSSRKGCSGHSKGDVLKQKTFHFERSSKGRMSKGAFKAKLTSLGGLVFDKKIRSPSDSSSVNMKNTSSKVSTEVGANVHHLSCNNPSILPASGAPATLPVKDTGSTLPAANTKVPASLPPETKPIPKPQLITPTTSKTPDYYAGIPYDKSLGKYVPQDAKGEMRLALVTRIQDLQKDLHGWNDWANEKVMQAARRLGKDQAELKTMRQGKEETEKFKQEKQTLEENTMKRLSEMENALSNAAGQIDMANATVCKLDVENSGLKKEMEAATLAALGSAENLREAVLREQEVLKKAQSMEPQKGLLQAEFTTSKREVAELEQVVEKAKGRHNQIEARRKQEEREKVGLLKQASSIRKEKQRLEALGKEEEYMIIQKAENLMLNYENDTKKLESEISELKLESESSKIAALRRGLNLSYGSCLTDGKSVPAWQGYQVPKASNRLAVFRDNFGSGSMKPEQECVMCLTEEMSVVFLPCAHQVLCAKCNELHEKQGMNDCPSCRTPIHRRINPRFASS